MCMKILEAAGKVNQIEYSFLLKGGVVLDRTAQVDNPCPGKRIFAYSYIVSNYTCNFFNRLDH